MRLTLRTLLAYADDILGPAQAKEIGAKIAETPEAAALMTRLREVLRKRRLGAPPLSGPNSGPDPNLVAEYLENTLSPSKVVELERLCLQSDMHLAEVASCHKILTLVLSEPIDVPIDVRERMYVLGASNKPAPVTAPNMKVATETHAASSAVVTSPVNPSASGNLAVEAVSPAPASPPAVGRNSAPSFSAAASGSAGTEDRQASPATVQSKALSSEGIPAYLLKESGFKKYRPILILGAVALAWGGVVVFDPAMRSHMFGPQQSPTNSSSTAASDANNAELGPTDATAAAPQLTDNQPPLQVDAPKGSGEQTLVDVDGAVEPQPAGAEEPLEPVLAAAATDVRPEMPANEQNLPAGDEVALAKVPEAAMIEKPPVPAPPVSTMYTSVDGVALVRTAGAEEWMVFPRRGLFHPGDELAVPQPYNATLQIQEAGLELTLQPGTVLTRLPAPESYLFAISLQRGQVAIRQAALAAGPVRVLVSAARNDWECKILNPDTLLGLEVTVPLTEGPPGAWGAMRFGGGIQVVSGAIEFGKAGNAGVELQGGGGPVLWPAEGEALKISAQSGVPAWLSGEEPLITPASRNNARSYEKEFALDRKVQTSISPVVQHRQAKMAELAVNTLSILGLYKDIVPGLQSEHEEARLAAIDGLREWLPRQPQHEALLKEQLDLYFREDQVQPIIRMLWGYSQVDARDPDISRQLVDWLGNDELAIRQLAFYHVFRLSGRRYDYRPDQHPVHLQAAVLRWMDHLDRNGALLAD